MKTTKVNTTDLLATLQKNRKRHKKTFKAAKKVWLKKATKALRIAADDARRTGQINEYPLVDLPKPEHYLRSYDTMIARLEAEVEPTVELDERECASYLLDQWDWHNAWVGTTSIYSS